MNKFWEFMKTKGFYIALGLGAVAFIALLIMYNYDTTKEKLIMEQGIDLNEPASESQRDGQDMVNNLTTEMDILTASDTDALAGNTDAEDEDKPDAVAASEEANNDRDYLPDEEEPENTAGNETAAENAATEEETVPASANPVKLEAALEYNGEKLLNWPLAGDVLIPFSMDRTVYFKTLGSYKCNPGMMIAGDEGKDVQSAYEGVVTAVEESKEFGTLVRVDMGNGYEAVYGQLMNICVKQGDTVSIAQNIGEVGPVTPYYEKEGTHLYFAITKDGKPVNPVTLIQ